MANLILALTRIPTLSLSLALTLTLAPTLTLALPLTLSLTKAAGWQLRHAAIGKQSDAKLSHIYARIHGMARDPYAEGSAEG